MKYVILLLDPSKDNPVRTLTGKRRREEAVRLAGYPNEGGDRSHVLNKNARDIVNGKKKTVNEAIEEFKRTHYNEDHETYQALVSQIAESREFLKSDKTSPLTTSKGVIVKDDDGNTIMELDAKKLKLAIEVGKSLPDLVDAKKKLEEKLDLNNEDTRYVGLMPTSSDIEDLSPDEQGLSMIDQVTLSREKNRE